MRMGRCTFDAGARCLRDAAGAEIALTAMEFDLLAVFARHPRQTLSRQRLAELAHGRPLEPGTFDAVAGIAAIALERAQFLDERKSAELARQS